MINYYFGKECKEDKMGGACGMHGGGKKGIQVLDGQN
jgi:hypothetical protein